MIFSLTAFSWPDKARLSGEAGAGGQADEGAKGRRWKGQG